jgi:hypothetical protein
MTSTPNSVVTDEMAEQAAELKKYVLERSRDPREVPSARDRALMACIVLPDAIQKWIIDAGAFDPLIESIAATIKAADEAALSQANSVVTDEMVERVQKLASRLKEKKAGIVPGVCGPVSLHKEVNLGWVTEDERDLIVKSLQTNKHLLASHEAWKIIAKQNDHWNALPQNEKEAATEKALDAEIAAHIETQDKLEAALSQATGCERRMREALVPFAKLIDWQYLAGADMGDEFEPFISKNYTIVPITIGDLRRAREALSAPPTPCSVEDEWRPIESAPKDGSYVLLLVQDIYGGRDKGGPRRKPVLSYWEDESGTPSAFRRLPHWVGVGTHWNPTHWRPILEFPTISEVVVNESASPSPQEDK